MSEVSKKVKVRKDPKCLIRVLQVQHPSEEEWCDEDERFGPLAVDLSDQPAWG